MQTPPSIGGPARWGERWVVSCSCWASCYPSKRWALAANAAPWPILPSQGTPVSAMARAAWRAGPGGARHASTLYKAERRTDMLTVLGDSLTIQACTWCGNQGTARVYKVTGEDGTGWACLTCVVLVLADSSQPVSFQGCSAHWLDALRRELVQARRQLSTARRGRGTGIQGAAELPAVPPRRLARAVAPRPPRPPTQPAQRTLDAHAHSMGAAWPSGAPATTPRVT